MGVKAQPWEPALSSSAPPDAALSPPAQLSGVASQYGRGVRASFGSRDGAGACAGRPSACTALLPAVT